MRSSRSTSSFPRSRARRRSLFADSSKVHLEPGASQKVHFDLKDRDLGMVTENGDPIIAAW